VTVAHAGDERVPRPAHDGAIGRCLRERRAVLASGPEHEGGGSELAVPVYAGGRLWGAIEVRSPRAAAFASADAQVVQAVADHVGAALLRAARVLEQR
jgi:GAF domain-containing protein